MVPAPADAMLLAFSANRWASVRIPLVIKALRGLIPDAFDRPASGPVAPERAPKTDGKAEYENQNDGDPKPEPAADVGIHVRLRDAGAASVDAASTPIGAGRFLARSKIRRCVRSNTGA